MPVRCLPGLDFLGPRAALRVVITACLTVVPLVGVASAQGLGGGIGKTGFQPPVHGNDQPPPARQAPPPGIPGATSPANVAPAQKPELDMAPTEALFDAINRGDVAAAKDALNRGADIYGRNVLGMTPVDLSVDLGRNDITFLLLSMRSQTPATARGPSSSVVVTRPANAKSGHIMRPDTSRRVIQAAAPIKAEPVVRYAAIPSTPAPQAGFLGFGSSATP